MKNTTEKLIEIIQKNRNGERKGLYSICSAHPVVLKASMQQALEDNSILLVESTSNQVDQYGGYTGMTPTQFVEYIHAMADETGFPRENLMLGGDHLGPNAWQNEPAAEAMEKARVLITEYVKAGYSKIHLDASMFCADDEGDRTKPLDDTIVADRAADLCAAAENTWKKYCSGLPKPLYIIGTEVPIPGGAQEEEDTVHPTSPEAAATTLEITRNTFIEQGLADAWDRVIGLVVQPGVEFGDDQVFLFDRTQPNAAALSGMIQDYPGLVYEAHSTDYQTETALSNLVEDHFCILKVGPWVTYAYREAVFALSYIEEEMFNQFPDLTLSKIRKVLEEVMMNNPGYWEKYYPGSDEDQFFKRKFSFSDRSRYYWPNEQITKSIDLLIGNLRKTGIPLSLLSQFSPNQYYQAMEESLIIDPENIIISRIRDVIGIYSRACGFSK
ncbi:MAG: D-tagatose-bisphosphate aldolase, class II, non-catalytic subunit [Bacteroidetes bacterium]|nr:D-tagatose-bisphosphate aldolase, class II, non-catalytic subunit [Bacteroidota bacterium]